jgi:hypothetical protein
LDRFFNFRRKILNKHAWLYGYLCKAQADSIQELRTLEESDPTAQTQHNTRPSEIEKIRKEIADKFRQEKKTAELEFADIMGKLSAWNTYFGDFVEGQYVENVEAWGVPPDFAGNTGNANMNDGGGENNESSSLDVIEFASTTSTSVKVVDESTNDK